MNTQDIPALEPGSFDFMSVSVAYSPAGGPQ